MVHIIMLNLHLADMLPQHRRGNLGCVSGISVDPRHLRSVSRQFLSSFFPCEFGGRDTYLLERVVSPNRLTSIQIRIHPRVHLVHHIAAVRTSRVLSRAHARVRCVSNLAAVRARAHGAVSRATAQAHSSAMAAGAHSHSHTSSSSGTDSAGTITIGIDTGVRGVSQPRAVRAVSTLGSAVVGVVANAHAAGDATGATGVGAGGEGVGCAGAAPEFAVASGAACGGGVAGTHAHVVGPVTVRVNTGISGVGDARVVRAVGALGGAVVRLVRVNDFLDLIDDAGHVGGLCGESPCECVCVLICCDC